VRTVRAPALRAKLLAAVLFDFRNTTDSGVNVQLASSVVREARTTPHVAAPYRKLLLAEEFPLTVNASLLPSFKALYDISALPYPRSGTDQHERGVAVAKDQPYLISEEEAEKLGIDEGSKLVNKLAKEQRISIQLTQEQLDAIVRQWQSADNTKPAEIIFNVEGRQETSLRVAAYAYYGDNCCA
jgi:hypothetical protein